jgi:hypothetical protein
MTPTRKDACPDCAARGNVYDSTCLRCVARHLAREVPRLADYYRDRLSRSMPRADFEELERLIGEEAATDRLSVQSCD